MLFCIESVERQVVFFLFAMRPVNENRNKLPFDENSSMT